MKNGKKTGEVIMFSNLKFLFCMKNRVIIDYCSLYLRRKDCSCYTCDRKSEELYNSIKETIPDVVICDRKLSDCVSYDVLEKLRQEGIEVKMFLTPSEYYITDRYFGRMPYFAKPINTKCLGCRLIHMLWTE